ncbi:hypothetical protein PIB30_031853 [Stylosanthes scabra]|uniref:cysteine dioxygenase n=1 Tax=Stylosanthes scabra TaxID=79078 RepID=A0ABU6UBD9_9FABA|nr:hypothetical protein [Stylosanthes scabra]
MVMSLSPGEKLFETCNQVFANGGPGIIPPPSQIESLRSILDAITPEVVGLKPDMPYFTVNSDHGRPTMTYLHIYHCEKFSMGIFCLPPSGVIPLHNHPGMTVFKTPEVRLAKVKIDADFTAPCNPIILYPAHGGDGLRFDGLSIPEEECSGYEWLQEKEFPDDVEDASLEGASQMYSGPMIVESSRNN